MKWTGGGAVDAERQGDRARPHRRRRGRVEQLGEEHADVLRWRSVRQNKYIFSVSRIWYGIMDLLKTT